MAARFAHQREIPAATLGLAAVSLDAQRVSNSVDASGFNQITLEIRFTRGAATGNIDMFIETSPDGTSWGRVQSEAVAAGIGTLSNLIHRKASASVSQNYTLNLAANYAFVRFTFELVVAADATDLLSVTARLGNI